MAELRSIRVPPPSEGVDTEAAPDYVAPSRAPVARNVVVRPGRAVMRGPLKRPAWLNAGATLFLPTGLMTYGTNALVSIRNYGGTFALRGVWTSGTGTPTVDTAIAQSVGPTTNRSIRIGAYAYGPGSYGSVNGDMIRWGGNPATAPTLMGLTTAPTSSVDISLHLERVFVFGGSLNGAGGGQSIMWSIPGGPSATPAATDWQDPLSGLYNQAVVGANDPDDAPIGLARVNREMVIFKRRAIYMLTGQTPSTFAIRRIASDYDVLSVDSIVEYADGCFFLSDRGLVWFDGSQMTEVSQSVRATLITAIAAVKAAGVGIPYYKVVNLGSGMLAIAVGYTSNVGTVSYFQYLYDVQRRTWTEFSFTLASINGFARIDTRTYFLNGEFIADASELPVPELAGTSGGKDATREAFGVLQTRSIPTETHSRIQALGSPVSRSQLHRLLTDYSFRRASAAAGNAWEVSLLDGRGTVLLAATNLAAQTSSDDELARLRSTLNVFSETQDVQVRVRWPDQGTAPPNIVRAEIYDAAVEYQTTSQRL